MKMMKSGLLMSIALSLVVLSACSKDSNKNSPDNAAATPKATDDQAAATATDTASGEEAQDGPLVKYDPPIEISTINAYLATNDTLPEGQTAEKNVWMDAMAKELGINVNVEWTVPSNQSAEKMQLAASSNDLPDMFGALPALYDQLVRAGKVEDLTEVYEKYASPELKALYQSDEGRTLNSTKYDGKIYGLPLAVDPRESTHMLWIRKDWLDKLNLQPPKSMDDVFAISKAFSTMNPNDTPEQDSFGLGLDQNLFAWDASLVGFFNAYHSYPMDANGNFFFSKGEDGKLIPGIKQPEIKPALLKLQELYKSGEIDKEFATKDGNGLTEQIAQNKVGMFFGGIWEAAVHIQTLVNENPDSKWIVMKIPSIDGTPASTILPGAVLQRIYVLKKGYEHPEAIIKMANLAAQLIKNEPETYHTTLKDERIWRIAPITPEVMAPTIQNEIDVTKAIDTKDASSLSPRTLSTYKLVKSYMDDNDVANWGIYKTFYGDDSAIKVVLDYESQGLLKYSEFYGIPTKNMNDYLPNLNTKFIETVTKIIMGGDISEYDKFLDYWDKQGGLSVEEDANAWYSERK